MKDGDIIKEVGVKLAFEFQVRLSEGLRFQLHPFLLDPNHGQRVGRHFWTVLKIVFGLEDFDDLSKAYIEEENIAFSKVMETFAFTTPKAKTLSPRILQALKDAGWSWREIEFANPESIFNAYLEWNGIHGYGNLYEEAVQLFLPGVIEKLQDELSELQQIQNLDVTSPSSLKDGYYKGKEVTLKRVIDVLTSY